MCHQEIGNKENVTDIPDLDSHDQHIVIDKELDATSDWQPPWQPCTDMKDIYHHNDQSHNPAQ